jgi:ATP/maltotriose-dependent transcriptional regulator MalT
VLGQSETEGRGSAHKVTTRTLGRRGLIGRAPELEALRHLVTDVRGGRAAMVACVGEPGIGKTSLLGELSRRALATGFRVFAGRGSELEPEVPFGLVVEAFDDPAYWLDPVVRRRLGGHRLAELAAVLPSLPRTGSGSRRGGSSPATPLDVERFRCYHAVRDLVEEMARHQPVLLVFDDVHWADQGSLELVAYLLRRGVSRCLLALAYRRQAPRLLLDSVADAARERWLTVLDVGPLSVGDAARLLGEGASAATVEALHVESGGNPFYLQQLWSSAQRGTGETAAAPAPSGTAKPELGADLPDTVREAIVRELAQLPAEARPLTHAAAIAGDPFDVELAAEIADMEVDAAYTYLDQLIASDAVRPSEVPGRFRFRHPIVRRAVYSDAAHGWRLQAHQRAAAALARRGADLGVQAHHIVRSGVPAGDEAAIQLLVAAGEAALTRAPAAAVRWLSGALDLLPASAPVGRRLSLLTLLAGSLAASGRLHDSRSTLAEAMQLLPRKHSTRRRLAVAIARVDQMLGQGERARRVLEAALAEVTPGGPEEVRLALALANNHSMQRQWDQAAMAADRARALATELGDQELVHITAAATASTSAWSGVGNLVDATALTDEVAAEMDRLPDEDLTSGRIEALLRLVFAEINLERWAQAEAHASRGVRICRSAGEGLRYLAFSQPLVLIRLLRGDLRAARRLSDSVHEATLAVDSDRALQFAESVRCWLMSLQGESRAALTAGQNAIEAARRSPDAQFSWMAHVYYGLALVQAGENEQGRNQILAAGGPDLSDTPPTSRTFWLRGLAAAEVALGQLDAADATAQRAEALASRLDLPMRTGDARYARASVLLAQGEHGSAVVVAREAVAAYDACGARVEAARARMLHADALIAVDDRLAAGEELEAACNVLAACGAIRLANQAARRLRDLGLRAVRKRTPHQLAEAGPDALSNREREVAGLAAQGFTNRQIAEELYVSRKTVETHMSRVFAKLGVSSRAAMASALDGAVPCSPGQAPTSGR